MAFEKQTRRPLFQFCLYLSSLTSLSLPTFNSYTFHNSLSLSIQKLLLLNTEGVVYFYFLGVKHPIQFLVLTWSVSKFLHCFHLSLLNNLSLCACSPVLFLFLFWIIIIFFVSRLSRIGQFVMFSTLCSLQRELYLLPHLMGKHWYCLWVGGWGRGVVYCCLMFGCSFL